MNHWPIGNAIVGGFLGCAIGHSLFHRPFGMGGSDLEMLICGIIGMALGWLWPGGRTHEKDEEDPASLDTILRDAIQARRRRGQPPLPASTDEHEMLGLAYQTGRDCRVLVRQVRFIACQPLFRLACCMLGGALLGHLIHATFFGGTLGALPRTCDWTFLLWTGFGSVFGILWATWMHVERAVGPLRRIEAR